MPIRRRTVRRRRPVRRRRYPYRRRRRTYRRFHCMRAIPNRMNVKLLYCDAINSSISASSNGVFIYQNSLYDPLNQIGGHQPLYFDQYATLYQEYCVKGISFDVQAVGHMYEQDGYPVGNLFLVMYAMNDNAPFTSLSAAREYRFSKVMIFGSNIRARMRGYYSVAKLWGVSKSTVSMDPTYCAKVNTDPQKRMYLFVQVFNVTGNAINCQLSVKLSYYSSFYRPWVISQS